MRKKINFSLRAQVIFFTVLCGLIPLLLTTWVLHQNFLHFFIDRLEKQVQEIAMWAADDVVVKEAYSGLSPDKDTLQNTSNNIKNRTGAYIIFMNMDGKVLSHPFPTRIGSQVIGKQEGEPLPEGPYISRTEGYLGPAIRGYAPIYVNGKLIGGVMAAFLEPDIKHILSQMYKVVYAIIPVALFLITLLSIILANNIKKRLSGMEPGEIATRLIEREGILDSVSDGIIATDRDFNITVINYAAQNLFPEGEVLIGRKVTDYISDSPLPEVIKTKKPQRNIQISLNGNIVLSNCLPLFINDKVVGSVITIRTMTEVNKMAEELTGVNRIVEALRARTHEFSNKLHAISGLLQLGSFEQAQKYVTSVARDEKSLVSCILSNFRVNAVAGLLMGKASEAEEKRIKFWIDPESSLFSLPESFDEHACVVVLGNLIENAFESIDRNSKESKVFVSITQSETQIRIEIGDNGTGIPENIRDRIFEPGFTTKPTGNGYGLANVKSRVDLAGGEISFSSDEEGTVFRVIIPYDILMDERRGGISIGTD